MGCYGSFSLQVCKVTIKTVLGALEQVLHSAMLDLESQVDIQLWSRSPRSLRLIKMRNKFLQNGNSQILIDLFDEFHEG